MVFFAEHFLDAGEEVYYWLVIMVLRAGNAALAPSSPQKGLVLKRRVCLFVLGVTCVSGTSFAAGPWDGTWALNPEKSHIVPPTLTIKRAGQRFVISTGTTYNLVCDGKEYPAPHSASFRCDPPGRNLVFERKVGDIPDRRWELAQSADGFELTETVTSYLPGVPPSTERSEYKRSAHSDRALAGMWMGVRTTIVGGDAIELRMHDGSFYFRDAEDGDISDAKLDGTPSPFLNAGVPLGITWSNVLESDRRIVGHPLKDGKPYGTEVMELSPDGKSIKLSHHDETGSYEIFEKQ